MLAAFNRHNCSTFTVPKHACAIGVDVFAVLQQVDASQCIRRGLRISRSSNLRSKLLSSFVVDQRCNSSPRKAIREKYDRSATGWSLGTDRKIYASSTVQL